MCEDGRAGTNGCQGSTVGRGGSFWPGTAAAFPKGSGGMVREAHRGAWTGGGRMGGSVIVASFSFVAGT